MNQPQKSTPRDVFLYLLMIVTLYIGVVSFIGIIWQYVNVGLPDQLDFYRSGSLNAIRGFVSALIVVWPIFLWMSYIIAKDKKLNIKVRKWLLYLTLFIAAITIIIDLITLINNFLQGELTLNFFLKTITVLVVAVAVFGYYLWQLKHESIESNLPRLLAYITSAVVIITIIAGFFIVGTPAKQRSIRFDDERVNNLQMIQSEIINYWQTKNALPVELTELNNNLGYFTLPLDPEYNQNYEYRILDEFTFELCATFSFASMDQDSQFRDLYNQNWKHQAGQTCFERKIDPDRYNTNKIPPRMIR